MAWFIVGLLLGIILEAAAREANHKKPETTAQRLEREKNKMRG